MLGLKACDTCRKARAALAAAGHTVHFRDVREEPLTAAEIAGLEAAFGAEIVNRRSTTWRGLGEAERDRPVTTLLADHPALMKRPVIRAGGEDHLGWTQAVQAALGV